MTKTFKINLGEKDIIVEAPDGLELTSEQAFILAGVVAQEQIVDGHVRVTERTWPCLYCGRKYLAQVKLMQHLGKHKDLVASLKKRVKGAFESGESQAEGTEGNAERVSPVQAAQDLGESQTSPAA